MNRREFLGAMGAGAVAMGLPRAGAHAESAAQAGAPAKNDAGGLPLLKGGDVSLLAKIEGLGGVFRDAGKPQDALAIFKRHGANAMRLRLFHTPDGKGPVCNDLPYTLKLARRIKAAGLALVLDLHYSDTWADPGHQSKPAAWKDLAPDRLEAAVFEYTRDVVAAHKREDALPDIVQIGNEITPGILWDTGRVGGKFESPGQWRQLAGLLRSGIRGVREAAGAADACRTLIHIDRGGDEGGTRWFFDHLAAEQVEFDLIGQSYYPWWHGSLDDLRANLAATARRCKKDIIVVEAGYPWTTKNFDEAGSVFGGDPAKLKASYPQTAEGQKAFLSELLRIVRQTPDGRGKGVLWWAPEWIPVKGLRSPWENIALFDPEGNALPALAAMAE
jgi:arabinogalactan endo-1,4-beta-galactosidase